MSPGRRGLDDLLVDLAEAVDPAAELVGSGKERWDAERPLRLAGEAVVGRIGDIATKPPRALGDRYKRVAMGTDQRDADRR